MNRMALGLVATVTLVAAAVGASSASATTFEVNGVTGNQSLYFTMSLEPGTSMTFKATANEYLINTCQESELTGVSVSPFSDSTITTPLETLQFSGCNRTWTIHRAGQLYVEHIPGSTDGTLFWENADLTFRGGTPYPTSECKTGTGTHIGTVTGKGSGYAAVDINAVLNCGFLFPALKWRASYVVTLPTGLGMSA